MNRMTAADFEALYRDQEDPWGYTTSVYERDKYAATLAACGPGRFAGALELGGSIGVFTEMLAPRCAELVTIDAAASAVAQACRRLSGYETVRIIHGSLPRAIPAGSRDLVIASEILYYLDPDEMRETLGLLAERMVPGGRMVAVHWRPAGPERPQSAAEVHDVLTRLPWLRRIASSPTDAYLLDVLERR